MSIMKLYMYETKILMAFLIGKRLFQATRFKVEHVLALHAQLEKLQFMRLSFQNHLQAFLLLSQQYFHLQIWLDMVI